MKLFFCLCGLLVGASVCSISAAADSEDRQAVPPEWVQMRTQEHVLAEINQVEGFNMPVHIFFLKCTEMGRPDMNLMEPGNEMLLRCSIWVQMKGVWRCMLGVCFKSPQGDLDYKASYADGMLCLKAEGFLSKKGADIAAWIESEEALLALDDIIRMRLEEKEDNPASKEEDRLIPEEKLQLGNRVHRNTGEVFSKN